MKMRLQTTFGEAPNSESTHFSKMNQFVPHLILTLRLRRAYCAYNASVGTELGCKFENVWITIYRNAGVTW